MHIAMVIIHKLTRQFFCAAADMVDLPNMLPAVDGKMMADSLWYLLLFDCADCAVSGVSGGGKSSQSLGHDKPLKQQGSTVLDATLSASTIKQALPEKTQECCKSPGNSGTVVLGNKEDHHTMRGVTVVQSPSKTSFHCQTPQETLPITAIVLRPASSSSKTLPRDYLFCFAFHNHAHPKAPFSHQSCSH
jgi:hypothetical protein